MKIRTSIAFLTAATLLSANSLIDKAKEAGLKPIPTDKEEFSKLIDNPNNPITQDKVILGRETIFWP